MWPEQLYEKCLPISVTMVYHLPLSFNWGHRVLQIYCGKKGIGLQAVHTGEVGLVVKAHSSQGAHLSNQAKPWSKIRKNDYQKHCTTSYRII